MRKLRAPAALMLVLGLWGQGAVPARGQERATVSDKIEIDRAVAVEFDPEEGNEIHVDFLPRVIAGAVDPDCNPVGGFFVTFPGASRYRGNVIRVTAAGRVRELQMELSFDDSVNFTAAIHRRVIGSTSATYDMVASIPVGSRDGDGSTNAPIFVSTGLINPPIALEPGYDYAIGFAWGEATMIYARDSVAHPVNFEIGRVLGSVAFNNVQDEPPTIPPQLSGLTIFNGGSYSMLICLSPETGACCDSTDQVCRNVLETQCTAEGSFFRGERTTCAETVCGFGACCDPCGTCDDNWATGACNAKPGATPWSGVSCPTTESALCPPVTGACCSTNGTCSETCQELCTGTFRGIGTSCEPNICKGACCINNLGCSNRTSASCTAFGGRFIGLGTECETLSGSQQCGGACCFGDSSLSTCAPVGQRELCEAGSFNFTLYRGDATTCPATGQPCTQIPPTADVRACCLPDGNCINTTEAACEAAGVNGEFNATVLNCSAAICSATACCLPDGECRQLSTQGCMAEEGSRPNPVVAACGVATCPTGACCSGIDGLCVVSTQAACVGQGGSYRGNNTDCDIPADVCLGIGSCCRPDGECFDDETSSHCPIIGGEYQGDGSTCGPSVDCDDRGACCATTGACLFVTADECADVGGVFRGAGEICAGNTCPTGACCVGESCAIRTPEGCGPTVGTYLGNGSFCTPGVCVRAACCFGDTCELLTETECLEGNGFPAGLGNLCDESRCLTGVCCDPAGECQSLRSHECAAADGDFAGVETQCILNACDVGACCREGACSIQNRASCEQSQNPGYFLGEGSICVETACVPGACCNGAGIDNCSLELRTTCELSQRTFRGAGSVCDALSCPCTNGFECDDELFCNGLEVCTDGRCGPGTPPCEDAFVCTADLCDEESDFCSYPRDDSACDDGNFCNGPESCSEDGATCNGGTPPDCDISGSCATLEALAGLVGCLAEHGPSMTPSTACTCLDLDHDGDVDLRDFAQHQNRWIAP